MSDSNIQGTNRLALVLGLAMALGPLTALSFGSKYASEETWARAQAAVINAKPSDVFAPYVASGVPAYAADKKLDDIVSGAGIFSTFQKALQEAGAEAILKGGDVYTVLAPSEDAFNALSPSERAELMNDKAKLAALVSRHIVPGRLVSTDLQRLSEVKTIGGDTLKSGPAAMVNGNIGVGGATIVQGNLQAGNGVVHVVDRVLL